MSTSSGINTENAKGPVTVFKESMNISSFIAGSIAGASGVLVGHPFDSLKVRMQVGQNLAITTWNTEVLRQLYRGIMPPLATVGGVAAINFAMYESFKALLRNNDNNNNRSNHNNNNRTPLAHIFLAGCLSGAVMSPFTSPMGVIKIQLQVAKQMTFKQCVTDILQRPQGGRLFYRGYLLSLFMESPGRGIYLWTYETVKALCLNPTEFPTYTVNNTNNNNTMEPYPLYLRAISASVAGIFSWFVVYPFDVIKARIQLDLSRNKYRSTWHCIEETYREGGFRGFFRGLSYTLIRAGPVAATILPVYDITKAALDEHFHPERYANNNIHHKKKNSSDSNSGSDKLEVEESSCNATTSIR